jgi:AcrR family transcriptional regulator
MNNVFRLLAGIVTSVNAMSTEKRKYQLKARAESQRRTRERIVLATMELHQEVGPAQTTVSEIARRADVQRLTVYNHFPDDIDLFAACQGHWMELHPLPDFSSLMALPDPTQRVRACVRAFYGWYRETATMAEKVQRDRGAVPALDALMTKTADVALAGLSDALCAGFRLRGGRAERKRALIRLALDFWTWRRLHLEGLDDDDAADLMAEAVACAATAKPSRR